MITYIVKSGICLMVLFGVYKGFLEKEKMLRFNRFYLLGSILFSLLIPFIKIELAADQLDFMPVSRLTAIQDNTAYIVPELIHDEVEILSSVNYFLLLYWIITLLFLIRFLRNIRTLFHAINKNPVLPFQGARFVLISATNTPYTFLNYIFIDEAAFKNQSIEEELFTHELAHVRQKHSWDIIFIELIISFSGLTHCLFGLRRRFS